jgi:integrase
MWKFRYYLTLPHRLLDGAINLQRMKIMSKMAGKEIIHGGHGVDLCAEVGSVNGEMGKRAGSSGAFHTVRGAARVLKSFFAANVLMRLAAPPAVTVGGFGRYWLEFEKADVRETTRYAYSVVLNNHVTPFFGEKPLHSIKREDIYKYFAHLRNDKCLNANTVRKHYDVLLSIFSSAEQSEKIAVSPMKCVRAPKPERFESQVYNPCQIVELFRAVAGSRLELAVHLAVYLGLRRGEICGLRWENVDLNGRSVNIVDSRTLAGTTIVDGPVKTATSERRLKIPDGLMPALLAAEAMRESNMLSLGGGYEDCGYVLCYSNGRPYRPNYLSLLFSQMLERNGLSHIRFHDLRHTFGSIAILGAPLYDVSKSLGHSRQDITQRLYIKDLTRVKSAAVDSVDVVLRAALAGGGAF